MKYKVYTEKEINEYKKNPFVLGFVQNKMIKYDSVFKLWCVLQRQKHKEKTCKSIFREAGFNIGIMNPNLPQKRISEWENNFYRYGYDYFLSKNEYMKLLDSIIKNYSIENDLKYKIYKETGELIK